MNDVVVSDDGAVRVVTIDRPHRRNAVDSASADAAGRHVRRVRRRRHAAAWPCSPAPVATSVPAPTSRRWRPATGARSATTGAGPMGPTRMRLSKPVIAAIEGPAVAGGLELALWCDLRVAASDAVLGVYCRRFGVPLVDLGTVRLPRLIGHSRAIDLILTGRGVDGVEAERIGLVNRVDRAGRGARGRGRAGPASWRRCRSGACATTGCRRSSSGTSTRMRRSATRSARGPRHDRQRRDARRGGPLRRRRRPRRDDRALHAPMIAACSSVRVVVTRSVEHSASARWTVVP